MILILTVFKNRKWKYLFLYDESTGDAQKRRRIVK